MKLPFALFVVLLTISAALASSEHATQKPVWHADWAAAQRIAKKTNRPIFAVLVCKH